MRIGVECGGTFTDVVVLDDNGELVATRKVFSTPDRPEVAVGSALASLADELKDGAELLHGSTVATNALIERKGARVGLIVTAGFRDLVYLQRQDRISMYDLTLVQPEPLVARTAIREVQERITNRGEILVPLDEESVRRALRELVDIDVEAVAVSLLHSYAYPAHEERVLELAAEEAPGLAVAISSRTAREFREYERTTTTTVDAFLRPHIARYLTALETTVRAAGISDLSVMQSNGGMVPARVAADNPVAMLRSGPAAGVAGAIAVASRAGFTNIITMDMGGTSTDVAVVVDGRAEQTSELVVDGLPLRVPMVRVTAVGAGGGSIASVDPGGLLLVGPESAGSDPGPVSYGLGGEHPTVTDANVVRGLIRPEAFLGGAHVLDRGAAEKSLAVIADRLDRTVEQVAEDVFELASLHMASAIRLTTTERGHDIEDQTLVAYGGAGPLHAATVADQLGVSRVLVPPHSGLTSAYGLLAAGFRREFSRTELLDLADVSVGTLERLREDLAGIARLRLHEQEIDVANTTWTNAVDMRYRGQGFEVEVPLDDDAPAELAARFHELHKQRYGHSEKDREVQIVTIRLAVTKPAPHLVMAEAEETSETDSRTTLRILERGSWVPAVFVNRVALAAGTPLEGPAVVEDETSTIYVPSGWHAHVDAQTNVILQRRLP